MANLADSNRLRRAWKRHLEGGELVAEDESAVSTVVLKEREEKVLDNADIFKRRICLPL